MQSGGGSEERGWMKKSYQMIAHGPTSRVRPSSTCRFPTRRHHHPGTTGHPFQYLSISYQYPFRLVSELWFSDMMPETSMRTGFLSLPTELRLQIASYALEQLPADEKGREELLHHFQGPLYKASDNLAIRLVCRQCNYDFSRLAIQKTAFVLRHEPTRKIDTQPDELLRDVRILVVGGRLIVNQWKKFPFNRECLSLDELSLYDTLGFNEHRQDVVRMLRCLQNVKQVSFSEGSSLISERLGFCRLIGHILKEDHYQRYDSPHAPQPEATWWSWSYKNGQKRELLIAQEPKPIMEEQDYLLLIKPKVDELMEQMILLST